MADPHDPPCCRNTESTEKETHFTKHSKTQYPLEYTHTLPEIHSLQENEKQVRSLS